MRNPDGPDNRRQQESKGIVSFDQLPSHKQFSRRGFIASAGAGIAAAALSGCARSTTRPNILGVTWEDLSPVLGCYGDEAAHTPHVDRLAEEGVRFTNAFATAPLCTPARSCLITGVHAISLGTHNLRGEMPLPRDVGCYTEFLREAGYFCTNNVKEDYNFATPEAAWDISSDTAHWRDRPGGQPFFSIFNLMTTHQSQVRYTAEELDKVNATLSPEERHDPARIPLPSYYPDTPVVRLNMATLYTQVTRADKQTGEFLAQLEEDGLAEDTIVFFYSDHGTGLPRGKRWLHDSGIRVPLVIRFPEKYRHLAPSGPGSTCDDLVSFVDFPPTMLSLIGLPVPGYMRGRSFLGENPPQQREYVFAARDRVDEVLDVSRTLTTGRWQYIRNYLPHRPRMQRSDYSEFTPIRQELRRLAAAGKLSGDAAWLMAASKPVEELYDLETDPEQLRNLAGEAAHSERLGQFGENLRSRVLELRDTGFLPEPELARRSGGQSPYDMARSEGAYPLERILDTAELVGRGADKLPELEAALADPDAGVRYWGAVGLAALGDEARPAMDAVRKALGDTSSVVRAAAAEAMCNLGACGEAVPVLVKMLDGGDGLTALHAGISLVYIGKAAAPAVPALEAAVKVGGEPAEHYRYLGWALNAVKENVASAG